MKKNKMMRIASVLLIAVLLSTCAISGTFAKYTTAASGSDTARVAKFGVTITTGADLFAKTYATADTAVISGNTVVSDVNVVAPGTSGTFTLFKISGAPEVAVKIDIALESATDSAKKISEIKLPTKNGYSDLTTAITDDTFDVASDYLPVVWTLKKDDTAVTAAGSTLASINTYLTGTLSKVYAPGKDSGSMADINGTYTLEWVWAFENSEITNKDQMDTYLAGVISGTVDDTSVVRYA